MYPMSGHYRPTDVSGSLQVYAKAELASGLLLYGTFKRKPLDNWNSTSY